MCVFLYIVDEGKGLDNNKFDFKKAGRNNVRIVKTIDKVKPTCKEFFCYSMLILII